MAKKITFKMIDAPTYGAKEIVVPTKPLNELKKVNNPLYTYSGATSSSLTSRRGIFEPPEYDLYEISRLEDVESLVRQANNKKIGLFLKEGFDIVCKEKTYVKYLKARFGQIAHASGIPFHELIRRTVTQLVKKSNAFLIKVRKAEASGGKAREDSLSGKNLEPVAGYFPAPPETMCVETDGSGKPVKWRQRLPSGQTRDFRPEDVVHFTFDRKEGFLYGTPTLVPVIDDIKALRNIEVNIEALIYKHLFPLFQWIVGTEKAPAGIREDGTSELEYAHWVIRNLPDHGAVVTPERHEIRSIGAENQALRAHEYLTYFKQRVIAGLGMSSVDFGEGSTSNRSTAVEMSRALIDTVKDIQDVFEVQFCEYVIKELMLESSFGNRVYDEENKVKLKFKEVDIDKQIKVQKHAFEIFKGYGTTWDEYRTALGLDPIEIPDDPHTQDPAQYPEWFRTYWKLFDEPSQLIRSMDESWTPAALAAAEARTTAITAPQLQKGQQGAEAIAKIKKAPAPSKDALGTQEYYQISQMIADHVRQKQTNEVLRLNNITGVRTTIDRITQMIEAHMMASFSANMGMQSDQNVISYFSLGRRMINSRASTLVRRLFNDIEHMIQKKLSFIDHKNQGDIISNIRVIFDTLHFRLKWIVDTEMKKAGNLGKLLNYKFQNVSHLVIKKSKDACTECASHDGKLISTESIQDFSNVLPAHPSCECTYGLVND